MGSLKTTVAVIVPCYNVAGYLRPCLDSILHQTHEDIRVYAVDDCSTDDTRRIIDEYAAKDSRVHGETLKKNSGVSVARNRGMEMSSEEWCIFVDGDDALPEDAVEKLLRLKEASGAQFVCGNSLQITEQGDALHLHYRERGTRSFTLQNDVMDFLPCQEVFCTCWNKLFSLTALKKNNIRFNSDLRHAQDTLFTHEYLLRCRPSCHIDFDQNVYFYRQRRSSCVHAILLKKRLASLEILVTSLDALAAELKLSRRMVVRKAAEYLWAIRKFSDTPSERLENARQLVSSKLFSEHLKPVLLHDGKLRHRLLMHLIAGGHPGAIRFW